MHNRIVSDHLIGNIRGKYRFPTVIAFAGIHGNEKAGVIALENIIKTIKNDKLLFRGNFYAIKGNLSALQNNQRFVDVDLNRIWTRGKVKDLPTEPSTITEIEEQKSLYSLIKEIVTYNSGPYYFLDLHTTSSKTIPFITISDSLNNRKFTAKFKLPIILGIEEYLDGPLLTYLNEFGHVSLGFEAGQHNDKASIQHCESFIWMALVKSRCISRKKLPSYSVHKTVLQKYKSSNFYHIKYKYNITEDEHFTMKEGYVNFQAIKKKEELATSNDTSIKALESGKIFMPLYQDQGEDGFFIISKVSIFWLNLSRLLRKLNLHEALRLLPGIKKASKYTLRVNPRTAMFLTTKIFHLFGYRKRVKKGSRWFFTKRDRKKSTLL
jgi:hypothetical protein